MKKGLPVQFPTDLFPLLQDDIFLLASQQIKVAI